MKHQSSDHIKQQRAAHLLTLARALYESAAHEEDKDRLELHRHVAVKLKQLIDEAINEDETLHPDLGLALLLFIELKAYGSDQAEADRQEVAKILADLEQ